MQEEAANRQDLVTIRSGIGGQGVLYVSDGDLAHWYWISDAHLVAVTTHNNKEGSAFVEAFATHTL